MSVTHPQGAIVRPVLLSLERQSGSLPSAGRRSAPSAASCVGHGASPAPSWLLARDAAWLAILGPTTSGYLIGALGLAACSASEPTVAVPSGTWAAAPAQAPAVQLDLHTPAGEPVDQTALTGWVTVVVFGFTSCPDVCPATLSGLGPALDTLASNGIPARGLFVAVDPERDTDGLDAYVGHFSSRITGVTGSEQQLNDAASSIGASFRVWEEEGQTQVEHATSAFILGPDGRVAGYALYPSRSAAVVADITAWWSESFGALTVDDGWIRQPVPGARVTAGYGVIRNQSSAPVRLVSASSPGAQIDIHETYRENGVTGMRPVQPVVQPGDALSFEPGGLHFMISGITADSGEVPVQLELESGQVVPTTFTIRP